MTKTQISKGITFLYTEEIKYCLYAPLMLNLVHFVIIIHLFIMLIDSVFYRVFSHDTLLTKHSYLPAFKQTEKYVQVVTCNFTSKVRDRTMSRKKKQ